MILRHRLFAAFAAGLMLAAGLAEAAKRPSAWSVTRYDGRTTAGTTSVFNRAILTITCFASIRGYRYALEIRRIASRRDLDGDARLSFVVQAPSGQVRTLDIDAKFFPNGDDGRAAADATPTLMRELRRGDRLEIWVSDATRGADSHLAGQFRLDGSSDAIAEVTARCR